MPSEEYETRDRGQLVKRACVFGGAGFGSRADEFLQRVLMSWFLIPLNQNGSPTVKKR